MIALRPRCTHEHVTLLDTPLHAVESNETVAEKATREIRTKTFKEWHDGNASVTPHTRVQGNTHLILAHGAGGHAHKQLALFGLLAHRRRGPDLHRIGHLA